MSKKTGISTLVCFTILIILIVLPWVVFFDMYIKYVYTLRDAARVSFKRAMNSNNLDIITNYTEGGLAYYKGFTGNPDWIFPQDYTDWELIINDMEDIIATARIASKNAEIGSDAYEEAVDSAIYSISKTIERLEHNLDLEVWNPFITGYLWFTIVWIIALLMHVYLGTYIVLSIWYKY